MRIIKFLFVVGFCLFLSNQTMALAIFHCDGIQILSRQEVSIRPIDDAKCHYRLRITSEHLIDQLENNDLSGPLLDNNLEVLSINACDKSPIDLIFHLRRKNVGTHFYDYHSYHLRSGPQGELYLIASRTTNGTKTSEIAILLTNCQ